MNKLSESAKEFFRQQGRKGGKIAAERLTPEERTERARKAGKKGGEQKAKNRANKA